MATKCIEFTKDQPGFLDLESSRTDIGITVSYCLDVNAIRNWKMNAKHLAAQKLGRMKWYYPFKVRVAKVEHDYGM